jgi:O-antigen/teichoic acid export membrane protein
MAASRQSGLLRHSLLLMAATQVANLANILFQAVMGWSLAPAEYGVLYSMLGVLLIVATPLDAVRTAMAHFSARLVAEGQGGEIRPLVWRWFRALTWFSIPLAFLGLVFSAPLARFFNLDSRVPVMITSLLVAGLPYAPVQSGVLQGVQAFVWMVVSQHSWSVFRLLAGSALVLWVACTAQWALTGQAVAMVLCFVLGMWGLSRVIPPAGSGAPARGVGLYFFRSLIVLGGFAVLMNADGILVKHYFSPEEAGLFGRAGLIGRSVIFLPMPIAIAMFPKVTSAGDTSAQSWSTMVKAMLFAVLVIAVEVAVFSMVPHLALLVLFRDHSPSPEMIRLVRAVLWAMSPLGLVYVLMNFEMAQHRFRAALWLVPCGLGYILGVVIWHETVFQVAAVLGAMSALATVLLVFGLPWRRRGVIVRVETTRRVVSTD